MRLGPVDAQLNAGKRLPRAVKAARTGEVKSKYGRSFGQTVTRCYLPTESFQLPGECGFQGGTSRYDHTYFGSHTPT